MGIIQSMENNIHTASDYKAAFAAQAEVVLSDEDFVLFKSMMTADTEPTDIALREAAEFRTGKVDGPRYHWKP